jgi:hypothetical protein
MPKFRWSFQVHDWSDAAMSVLQTEQNARYKKWFGLTKSAEVSILYRRTNGVGLTSFTYLVHVAQIQTAHVMKTSKDPAVLAVWTGLVDDLAHNRTGRGRKKTSFVVNRYNDASWVVRFKQMLGDVRAPGDRRGVGATGHDRVRVVEVGSKEECGAMTAVVRQRNEDEQLQRCRGLVKQGAWYTDTGEDAQWADFKWVKLAMGLDGRLVSWLLNANLQTLPTPDNVKMWNQSTADIGNVQESCALCGKWGATTKHVLCFCAHYFNVENEAVRKATGTQYNRVTWRHDQVLRRMVAVLMETAREVNGSAKVLTGHVGDTWSFVVTAPARTRWELETTTHAGLKGDHRVVSSVLSELPEVAGVARGTFALKALRMGDVTLTFSRRADSGVIDRTRVVECRIKHNTQNFRRQTEGTAEPELEDSKVKSKPNVYAMYHVKAPTIRDSVGRCSKGVRDKVFQGQTRSTKGLYQGARDWVVMSDLTVVNGGEVLTFPTFASTKPTSKRPDIVLVSCESGTVIIVELTAGWDGNQTDQHATKSKKYHDEFDDGVKEAGWELHIFCVEVGCRGLISGSFAEAMRKIGLAPRVIKKLVAEVAQIARMCSWVIYTHREQRSFVYNAVHAHAEHGVEWKALEKVLKAQEFEVGVDLVTACAPVRVEHVAAGETTCAVEPSGAGGAWAWARGPTVSSVQHACGMQNTDNPVERRVRWDVPPSAHKTKLSHPGVTIPPEGIVTTGHQDGGM